MSIHRTRLAIASKLAAIPRALAKLLLLAALLPLSAKAATTPVISVASKTCLDASSSNRYPGTRVHMWDCHGRINQQWEFTSAGELRTFGGTRCLDVEGGKTASGTWVVSSICTGGPSQKWLYRNDGTITGVQSGRCLDIDHGWSTRGTKAQIWTCLGNINQKWLRNDLGMPDAQAPTPPAGLAVSALACRSLTLAWNASTDNVGVAFYDVYHDGQLMTSVSGSLLRTALTVTPGASWGLYVNARDAAGNVSQASVTRSVAVPYCTIDTQPPTTPAGLKGSVAGTTATLSWTASSDNVGVTAYDVYRNDVKVGSTPHLAYTDSGLAINSAHRYAVAARDAQGNVSARSSPLELTTGGACGNAVCSVAPVATETDIPWGLVTLPDGSIIYSRRDAHDLVRLDPATGIKTSVGTVPGAVSTDGEGGVLGVAITQGFPATDPWIYIQHSTATDNRIVRIQYANGVLKTSTLQVLLSGIGRNKYHNGGRLRFGPDGKLYSSTGDAQNAPNAQDRQSLDGKVLRLNPDGSLPPDNPFGNFVWSYGHRNPQGLAFDSQGRLWEQEFGNGVMDETNLIVKGGNYGWPDCEGTVSQSGGGCATAGYVAPKYTYAPINGSCSGIAIVRDVLYVACERGTRLYREVISGSSLTDVQQLFSGTYGRLRTVEPSRDGGLWLTTTNAGDKDSIANNSNEKILKVMLGP